MLNGLRACLGHTRTDRHTDNSSVMYKIGDVMKLFSQNFYSASVKSQLTRGLGKHYGLEMHVINRHNQSQMI